jgi:Pyruvate/2-oxoacid:ferredoxin oxidoreductase delta subunit
MEDRGMEKYKEYNYWTSSFMEICIKNKIEISEDTIKEISESIQISFENYNMCHGCDIDNTSPRKQLNMTIEEFKKIEEEAMVFKTIGDILEYEENKDIIDSTIKRLRKILCK